MKPSLPVILWNDWPALASWIGVVMIWTLYCVFLFLEGAQQVTHLFPFAIAMSFVCFALAFWRVGRVKALFTKGIEVQGQITRLSIVRDRGRLEFCYQVDGTEFECWAPVHKTARVLAFAEGQAVRVLVDPTDSQHAIVSDLYVPAFLAPASITRQ